MMKHSQSRKDDGRGMMAFDSMVTGEYQNNSADDFLNPPMDPTVLVTDDHMGPNPKYKDFKSNPLVKVGLASALKVDNLLKGMAKKLKDRYYFELNKHHFFNTGDHTM